MAYHERGFIHLHWLELAAFHYRRRPDHWFAVDGMGGVGGWKNGR